jgi:hypothetical protein
MWRYRRRAKASGSVAALRRGRPFLTLTSLSLLALLGTGAASAVAGSAPDRASAVCEPRLIVLPGLTATSSARVDALSDSGWVAGTSWEDEAPFSAVVWTDPERIVDTGVGGVTHASGNAISAMAIDVNEGGTVAINRWKESPRGRFIAEDALVWNQHDGATVLPTSRYRPRASVMAINNRGDVLGHVRGRGRGSVPVVWKDGERDKLPVPSDVEAYANDINDDGLVVGMYLGRYSVEGSWTWDGGPQLTTLRPTDTTAVTEATDVDESGRIIGRHPVGPGDGIRTILWRTPAAAPQRLMRIHAVDLHNSGYLAAVEPGFRGYGATAYVGHRRDGGVKARLPRPPTVEGSAGWSNIRAAAVARGSSRFAPQGGVTIGGSAQDYDLPLSQAVVWTCTQTRLDP